MKNKFKNLKSKKGITIVEVVITLVLIATIMASAISVIMMSIEVENNSAAAVKLQTSAENILECYRFAKTEEEFAEAIAKCGDFKKADDGSFVLAGTDVTITVKSNFTENKLEFSATNSNGDEIYSFGYQKNETNESSSSTSSSSSSAEALTSEVASSATQEGEDT